MTPGHPWAPTRVLHFKGIPLCFQFKYQASQQASQWTWLGNLRWSAKPLRLLIWINNSLKDNQFGSRGLGELRRPRPAWPGQSIWQPGPCSPPGSNTARSLSQRQDLLACIPGTQWAFLEWHPAFLIWASPRGTKGTDIRPVRKSHSTWQKAHFRQQGTPSLDAPLSPNTAPLKEGVSYHRGGEAGDEQTLSAWSAFQCSWLAAKSSKSLQTESGSRLTSK